jgi:hypothetical protein
MTKFGITSLGIKSRGIHIYMSKYDSNPPHFYMEYNGQEIIFGLNDLKLIEDKLPLDKKELLLGWANKLVNAWTLCQKWN